MYNKRRIAQKILASAISAVMFLGLLPIPALAAGEEGITLPFDHTLTFSEDGGGVVEDDSLVTFKYTFTLTEETKLLFYGKGVDTSWQPGFTLWSAEDEGDMASAIYGRCTTESFTETLDSGDYALWIDDDGYFLEGIYTARVYISVANEPGAESIALPFDEEVTFSPGDGAFSAWGDMAYGYTFTLDEAQDIAFWSNNYSVYFHVFEGGFADADIFLGPASDAYKGGGYTLTLPLDAGQYTVAAYDVSHAGAARVYIGVANEPGAEPITPPFIEEVTFSPGDGAFSAYWGDMALGYTFTLDEAKEVEFWSDNNGVHFFVFEGAFADADIFSGSDSDAYKDDSHDLELFLEAGVYTVVAADCDRVGAAQIHITFAPANWGNEEAWSGAALDPDDARYAAYTEEPGTSGETPYLVKTEAEFAGLFWTEFYDWYYDYDDGLTGKYVKLAPAGGALDFSAREWMPIPYLAGTTEGVTSVGEFDDATAVHIDGNGTVIRGLSIARHSGEWPGPVPTQWGGWWIKDYGLFGMVVNAEIKNLVFNSPCIQLGGRDSGDFAAVGTLAAAAGFSNLRNITVLNPDITLAVSRDYTVAAGGVAGYVYGDARITGAKVTGGTVGISGTGGAAYYDDGDWSDSYFYAGGIAGACYDATIINAWSNTAVSITDDRKTDYDKHAIAGGIAGWSSLTQPLMATCILNSFSIGPVTVTQTGEADESSVLAGGLAGYISDSAVNNYSRSAVTADSFGGDVYSGKLFGYFEEDYEYTDGGGEYILAGNYYAGGGPIGDYDAGFDPAEGCVQMTTASALLEALNAGREDAANAIVYHSAFDFETALAKVASWFSDYRNGGWPTFEAAAYVPDDGGGSAGAARKPGVAIEDGKTIQITVNTATGNADVNFGAISGTIAGGGSATVAVPPMAGVTSYTATLPADTLSGSAGGSATMNTELGSVTLPSDMLSGAGLTGSVGVTIGTASEQTREGLPDDVRSAIGDRPIIQLTLTVNGTQTSWSNPDAPVTVSIPYTPTAEELNNLEGIVIWYIDGSGNAQCVANGRYDPASGMVTFDTTHFSDYAVAYNPVSFNDAAAGAWYYKAVSFIAARGITTGTGNGNYSPEAKLTRGEFLVMVMKAYGIAPDTDLSNNFADAGSAYYTGYLAAAKRLGISSGEGNNMYAPGKEITRQEMFTLLYNVLKVIGKLPKGTSGKSLSAFSDAGEIASWAKDAMELMTKTGTISGSGGKLSPASATSRAEMAQMLYNLLSK